MQRAASASNRKAFRMAIVALAVSSAMIAGSGLNTYADDSAETSPDITELNLDQHGADIAVEETRLADDGPDISALSLDQHGADIAFAPGTMAYFQMYGEPIVVAETREYVAGPHYVAGGNEGPDRGAPQPWN